MGCDIHAYAEKRSEFLGDDFINEVRELQFKGAERIVFWFDN